MSDVEFDMMQSPFREDQESVRRNKTVEASFSQVDPSKLADLPVVKVLPNGKRVEVTMPCSCCTERIMEGGATFVLSVFAPKDRSFDVKCPRCGTINHYVPPK